MKAHELKKEVKFRVMMNQWIFSNLLPAFVLTAGKPVHFPGRLKVDDDNPLSTKGAMYLRNLDYIVTEKVNKESVDKDMHIEISLP